MSFRTARFSLQSPLGLHRRAGNSFLTNKLSLNLLQDRLACASQLSLEGVIATNLVVNSHANQHNFRLAGRPRHGFANSRPWRDRHFSPVPADLRLLRLFGRINGLIRCCF
jgi:hypothetical protein